MTLGRRALGIDYGSTRIGIAVSDPLNIIARGLEVVQNTPRSIERIRALAEEYDVGVIVVGMPYNLKGEMGKKAQEVELFMAALRTAVGRDVVSVDERFTSQIAQQTLIDMGVRKKARQVKGVVDLTAAALILQQYLDGARTS